LFDVFEGATGALDFGEDRFGLGYPDEGLGRLVEGRVHEHAGVEPPNRLPSSPIGLRPTPAFRRRARWGMMGAEMPRTASEWESARGRIMGRLRHMPSVGLAIAFVGLAACSGWLGAAEEPHLTDEQVEALVPNVLKLHLLRPELDAAHMRRLLKRFEEQLDPWRTAYLKGEIEAQTKLTDEELASLGTDIRAGRLEFFTKWVKTYQKEILPRDEEFVAGLDKPEALKTQLAAKVTKEEWGEEAARAKEYLVVFRNSAAVHEAALRW
jgi:hypothetical protein